MTIRLATLDDLPAISHMGREMHGASGFAGLDYDEDAVKATFARMIDQKQFVAVAENNGQIIGGMAGRVEKTWFGADSVAVDVALFVMPDQRGAMRAVEMINAFVHWSRLAGARQVRPGVTTGSIEAEKLYTQLGFARCGAQFMLDFPADGRATLKDGMGRAGGGAPGLNSRLRPGYVEGE
jgi:L-amino acid N-acyltransferase YncA